MVQSGMERIKSNIMSQVKKGRMKQDKAEKVLKLAKGTLTYDDFGSVDMVIEAAIEDINLKQQVSAMPLCHHGPSLLHSESCLASCWHIV